MQLSRIRAISFDLDDTLWPFLPCIERAEAALLQWLHTNAPKTREILHSPDTLRQYRVQATLAHPHLQLDLSGLRRASIRSLLAAAREDVGLAEPAFEVFFEERQKVEVYEDILPALSWLSARFPIVGLSNGNGSIQKAGLSRYFQGSLSAAELGVAKPDAEAFHAAARAVGVQTPELLHVGDDWHLDVIGAAKAGAQAAWLVRSAVPPTSPTGSSDVPHAVVSDLLGLCISLGKQD